MRPILSLALLVAAAAQAAPPRFPTPAVVLAQAEEAPSVPGPGAETSVPPPPARPPEPKPEVPRAPTSRPEPTVPMEAAEAPKVEPALAPMDEAQDEQPVLSEPERARDVDAPVTPEDAPVLASSDEAPRTTDVQQQRLVNGAPLYNPNVSLHIVQKKRFADESKHELALYPAVVQVNGKYTNHAGTALHYSYHLQENFALQVTGQYNWHTNESDFNLELIDKVREQAQAASSLLLVWGAQAGVEVTPLYGKFAFLDDKLAQFSLVLSGGAGVGSTRHLIRPEVSNEVDGQRYNVPARFGDTGNKFLGSVGGGFRLQFGESYALRLEVRDLIYTARVDKVDGCNLADFETLEAARAGGQEFSSLQLSGSCKYEKFDGVDPKTKKNYREDIILGRDLVAEPSSDVLNNISFYAGFSFLF
ncbi:outer membrane beta-barrel domain-containing protein [Myxococcus sp. CA051A]|uniref:outer membrane beta-barrel domain-containing protein n=1 Tax=unclassified Myxococcus TaxID=2648731 RepID=UPI00157B2DE7|nr:MULTISPECIES: outer membrane beta-barrel domain-containing protein [unclassified Myxococcus]NTX13584.1 outer membrane beta-barrel domain-containing protein [Myxococcus sp. CA056]NTX67392.1 outer membrane beta-barrel domain-containing protein [Myxococcus sp. CA051A]